MSDSILYKVESGVATITLNRPDKFNSFTREMALACQARLEEAAIDPEVRAIYLTGAGKAFCAGQDLGEAIAPDGPGFKTIVFEHYNPIITQLRSIEKPIVAGINGVAAGAGANIAFACDITIATESASFIQAFSKIGLVPDNGGTWTLPRMIGLQKAAALMMLGDKVSATDAERMNMIYKVVPNEEFEATAYGTAQKLAKMPTVGIGYTKRLLNATFNNNLHEQLNLEGDLQIAAGETEDYSEGVNAFLEKRKPEFKGA